MTSDDRRDVAIRLRKNAGKRGVTLDYLGGTQVASWWLLLHTIDCDSNEQEVAFRMLADLIDPTCRAVHQGASMDDELVCSECGALLGVEVGGEQMFVHDFCPCCGARVVRPDDD